MSENRTRSVFSNSGGIFQGLSKRVKLIMRLMLDSRVSPLLKLIPIGSLIYLIVPLDMLFGPLDDAAVIWVGAYLFVELCPPEVVQEHMRALDRESPDWTGSQSEEVIEGKVIDVEPPKKP